MNKALLKAYDEHPGPSRYPTKQEMVLAHLYLVKIVVDKMSLSLPSYLDREDLKSAAMHGLVMAAERFDPGFGVQFNTFAENRIRGTILDELRAQDHLSRGLRAKTKAIEKEVVLLEHRLGRSPTDEETATALEMELGDYQGLQAEISFYSSAFSLDEAAFGDEEASYLDLVEDVRATNPHSVVQKRQDVDMLASAIDGLGEQERLVVTLYYYEDLNLKEIGSIMDLTESRISQIHSQAVKTLRKKLKKEDWAAILPL